MQYDGVPEARFPKFCLHLLDGVAQTLEITFSDDYDPDDGLRDLGPLAADLLDSHAMGSQLSCLCLPRLDCKLGDTDAPELRLVWALLQRCREVSVGSLQADTVQSTLFALERMKSWMCNLGCRAAEAAAAAPGEAATAADRSLPIIVSYQVLPPDYDGSGAVLVQCAGGQGGCAQPAKAIEAAALAAAAEAAAIALAVAAEAAVAAPHLEPEAAASLVQVVPVAAGHMWVDNYFTARDIVRWALQQPPTSQSGLSSCVQVVQEAWDGAVGRCGRSPAVELPLLRRLLSGWEQLMGGMPPEERLTGR
ncbi:hypothetical protein GPECTOR_12g552 [Gonium pectorale]|uniref:Uncharacterized protein n=1 Tax=Gonium pectorale TaxID=33097 RepID=A0A150GPC2_GONPE|nr:hypothetical protein GPECTOR_12g552 [Gonium pectorale]|eukprot:KXZ51588.1 hypothetical protein GPECTOR_12g552 [Gonium pectorale]